MDRFRLFPSGELGTHPTGEWTSYADAQRALDAEREKVKEYMTNYVPLKALEDVEAQLATLQAQLRQVEGERGAHAQDVDDLIDCCINDVLVTHATPGGKPHDPDPQIRPLRDKIAGSLVELQALRQLVEAFRSSEEWGAVKAWMVEGAPTRQEGVEAAKRITKAQYEMENALVVCRQALAAQDAGKAVSSG